MHLLTRWRRPWLLAGLAGLLLAALPLADFSEYHTYDELTAELRRLTNAHPNLARLVPIGETLEGRTLWVVEIANRNGGAPIEERPAVLIAANFEGTHVVGSELALATIEHLLTSYTTDENVRQNFDERAFFVIPRANPDGAERMFARLRTGHKSNMRPHDDDNDGRTDEDGPDDLNGDGLISVMRVADPNGPYFVDPADPRLMKKADPTKGESGGFSLYWEGRDDDNDGFYNEDAPGGVDLNRNFQHQYPYYQRGAGPHMVSENEARAIMDWMITHRNVGAILTFGESDNLITPPNQRGELPPASGVDLFAWADDSFARASRVGMMQTASPQQFFGFGGFGGGGGDQGNQRRRPPARNPEVTVNRNDLTYFNTVSEKYKEITGIRQAPPLRHPQGAFFEWGYYQFGVPSFSTPGWGLTAPAAEGGEGQRPGPAGRGSDGSMDQKLLTWLDGNTTDGFVAWTSYQHPQLGAVEIGGFDPYAAYNPPAEMVEDLGQKHAAFALYLASILPEIRIADTEVTSHGGGIFRVKVEVENSGFLPTSLAHGVTARAVKPTMVQLGVAPEAILSGAQKTSFFQALDGSGKRQTYQWVIQGREGQQIEVRAVSQKGGSDVATLTLR